MFSETIQKFSFPTLVSVVLFFFPFSIFAQSGQDPVSSGLQWFIDLVYGPIGIGIATLAIMSVGLLCLGHYLKLERLIQTIIGVALVFGAGAIVALLRAVVHRG